MDLFDYVVREVKPLVLGEAGNSNPLLQEKAYRVTLQLLRTIPNRTPRNKYQSLTLEYALNDEPSRFISKMRTQDISFHRSNPGLSMFAEVVKDQKKHPKERRTWRLFLKLKEERNGLYQQAQQHGPRDGNGNGTEVIFVSVNCRKTLLRDRCGAVGLMGRPCSINSKCWREDADKGGFYHTEAITLLDHSEPVVLFGRQSCISPDLETPEALTAVVTINRWNGTGKVSSLPLQFQQLLAEKECFVQQLLSKDNFETWLKKEDIVIECSDGKMISAHRDVLMARSSVFAAMLALPGEKGEQQQHSFTEGDRNKVVIQDVSSDAMEVVLAFIYSGHLQKKWRDCPRDVVGAADKYDLKELLGLLDSQLSSACDQNNAMELAKLAELHGLEKARAEIEKYIRKNLRHIYTAKFGGKRAVSEVEAIGEEGEASQMEDSNLLKKVKQEVPEQDQDQPEVSFRYGDSD